jgi:hypothetical protein
MDQDSLKGMVGAGVGVLAGIVASATGVHIDPAVVAGVATVISVWLYQHGKVAAAKAGAAAANQVTSPAAAAAVFNNPAQLPPAPAAAPAIDVELLGAAIARALVTLTAGAKTP